MDLTVLFQLSYGLYVVCADDHGRPAGCIVNTVVQITNENPIVALSMNKDNYTYQAIKRTGRFSVSILSEQSTPSIISKLGFFSGKNTDKFANVPYELSNGLPLVKDHCSGYLVCNVLAMHETETHYIITARVSKTIQGENVTPMNYDYYHKVIKGKAPKNAPTYQKEVKATTNVSYVCTICGYVHQGDINQESEDYICPICGVSKDLFEKQ